MYGVIEEANSSNQKGWSSVIWVMRRGRLIAQNTKQIYSTPITTEQCLLEQIKKATG